MSSESWRTDMMAERLSPLTIEQRMERLRLFEGWLGRDPSDAASGEITGYLAQLRTQQGEPPSASSTATYKAQLRAYYRWLFLTGARADDPFAKIKPSKVAKLSPSPITVEQFHRLLALQMRRPTRMMILLAAYQGLRCHEISKVQGQDVDLESRQMRVAGKAGSVETIELHHLVVEEAARFPRRGWWFPSPDTPGGHISPRSVSNHGQRMMRAINVERGGFHRLRHLTASRLLEQGVNLRHVQTAMRHRNIASTTLYAEVTRDQMRAVMDNFEM